MKTTLTKFFILCAVFLSIIVTAENVFAKEKAKYHFKIASLAPENSIWMKNFNDFAKEVSVQTNGEVGFRTYPGGSMGDDLAMYRKMRVGQLQGGGFTMSGIAGIVEDFRVMAIPFLFNSYGEVDYVLNGLAPMFKKKFDEKGLHYLAFTEVGFVYAMSTEPIGTMADFKATKSWTPSGDLLSTNYLKNVGINSTQLSLPDVLSSLQTGMIETVYNSLYGSIVLQWFTSLKYVNNVPSGYAYGAILLDGKKYNKLPKKYQDIIDVTAEKFFPPLIEATRKTNRDSKTVLMDKGLTFQEPSKEMVAELSSFTQQIIDESIGELFSKEAYNKMNTLLEKYRSQVGAK
ncbi:MAG: TRAP transporter substrate-binding protein DctP [Desulfotalea sp.]